MSSMDRIVDDVRASQDAALADPSRRLAVRNRLLAEPRRRRGARSLVPVAIAGGLAAAAALVIAFYPRGAEPTPLTYTANAEPMRTGEFLAAPNEQALSLEFSDGSRVTLDERSSGRVDELTARGARVSLEHGAAEVRVVHRETTEWTVVGGPYEVQVIGTAFRVAWDASAQRFELALHEGRVRVTGPRIGEREIAAGERLEVSPDEPWAVREDPPAGRAAAEEEAPAEPQVDAVASAAPVGPRAAREPATHVQRVQTPHAQREHRAAASQDTTPAPTPLDTDAGRFDAMLATGTLDALEAAATAARGQRDPRATRVYHALRQRFRGTEASADAAFFLARDAQRTGDLVAADRWLRTYIAEAPNGRFDAEARGRNIEVVAELGLADQARQLAASYLARYPNGAHAAYARQIAQPR